jgi:Xaa-Pro aminopeptidase
MVANNRQRLLKVSIGQEGLDSILISSLPNIRYLCGFTGSSGALATARDSWMFFTDGRYTEQAKHQVKGASVQIGSNSPAIGASRWIAERIGKRRSARIGFEADHVSFATEKRIDLELRSSLRRSGYRVVPTTNLVENLRVRKDKDEVKRIGNAVRLASGIFLDLMRRIRSSMNENEVAAELEFLARRAGAEKMSFDTIVASGPNSALPHARPSRRRIGSGFVVLDYGVILAGYCSDMTRTVWVGRATGEARQIYAAVLEAQLAAIAAVAPGVEAQAVDGAAREVLRKHKLDKYFTHSLGHGVGLEIHEAPRLAKAQTQKLEPGMVVTIEPGVYIPGKGGVRIEDMVLVTKTGCEVLTPTPKEFLVL